jgi:hypothetical protein
MKWQRREGNKKEFCLQKGRGSCTYSCVSLEIQQLPRGPTPERERVPPSFLGRTHLYWNLPCNLNARFHLPYSVQPLLDMLVCFCDTTQDSLNFFAQVRSFGGSASKYVAWCRVTPREHLHPGAQYVTLHITIGWNKKSTCAGLAQEISFFSCMFDQFLLRLVKTSAAMLCTC